MANVRDSDTSLWLHNKLGTSNDSWTGSSICSQLNAEVLRNIKDCFPDLQTQVKLKLLLSFFHIPRRNVEEVSCRRNFSRYNRLFFLFILDIFIAPLTTYYSYFRYRYFYFLLCHEFFSILRYFTQPAAYLILFRYLMFLKCIIYYHRLRGIS